MTKRVLHLGAGNLYGGIETLLLTLARERSVCPEMAPEFGLCFEGRLSEELRQAGVPVHQFGNVRFSRPWSVWRARRSFRSRLAADPPDVIVSHSCWPHAVFGMSARGLTPNLFFWAHGEANPRHWLDRKAASVRPKGIIANSQFTASTLNSLFDGVPMSVLTYPVKQKLGDRSRRDRLRQELGAVDGKVVILMVSRMEAWKGHKLLLDALHQLQSDPRWVCWIAGGAQRPEEQQYRSDLGRLENAYSLKGRIFWLDQRDDVPDLMAAADIFCQPNLGPEPFGIVFVEALYSGLPVVTTRMGGGAEVVDDSCGILTDPGNAHKLAETIALLLHSPEQRAALGVNGPARAAALCDAKVQLQKLAMVLG